MIAFTCPGCKTEIQRPDSDAGTPTLCPKCYFALRVPGAAASQFQSSAPRAEATRPAPGDVEEYLIVCPRCLHSTESLKAIEIWNLYFLILFFASNREFVIGCPRCVRSILFARIVIAILASNILFPIVGVFYLLQYLDAGTPGHSDLGIAHAHRMPIGTYIELPRDAKPISRARDWLIAVLLILLIGGVVGAVVYRLGRGW